MSNINCNHFKIEKSNINCNHFKIEKLKDNEIKECI